ncbi:aldo/keto reductase [Streptomyces phaeoluteigriseus]|uniref:aldo/keto reductase n=1 Tax=Streptomyces phaeoluteigriseus TaxID=114686 RepID=UPI00092C54E9|nr:aldo/keto reductase [Streptomyces phaeoluteigriseus]
MRSTAFGRRTGLRVSAYALGTANFGTGWGAGAEPGGARRIFDRFARADGTFLDSADGYQFGESEELTDEQYTGSTSPAPCRSARPPRGSPAPWIAFKAPPIRHRPGPFGGLSPERGWATCGPAEVVAHRRADTGPPQTDRAPRIAAYW